MLRTIFVLGIAAAFLPYALQSPFAALLFYLWVSYFRPEEWVWTGAVGALNLPLVVGLWVVLFTFLSRRPLTFGTGPVLLALVGVHSLVSTWLSPAQAWAWPHWIDFAKVLLMSYLMLVLVRTEHQLRLTIAAIALSLAFDGARQGWANLILHPGAPNTNSWPLLGDNNGVAIGMLMVLALLIGLIRTSSRLIERRVGQFLAVGVTYRALSTYSRGGFLALSALLLNAILHSQRKLVSLLAIGLVASLLLPVLPDAFWERMSTIQTAARGEEIDASSRSRLHFWNVAVVMANDRPFVGVGHDAYASMYNRYDTSRGAWGVGRAAHSMWFGLLAEWGYTGFLLFVLLIGRGFFVCRRARRLARDLPALRTLAIYSTAIKSALLAAVVGGTFFPFQYNEMLWHTIALSMVAEQIMRDQAGRAATSAPAVRATPASPAARRTDLAARRSSA